MKLVKKPKIIMNILSSVGIDGGVPNKVMDIYRAIDRNKYQFHFFLYTHNNSTNTFEEEIKSLGGKVFYYGKIREVGFIKFYFNFYRLLKLYPYDVIHSYNGINDGLLLLIARIAKIDKRISHSRGAQINSGRKRLFMPLLKKLITQNSNILLACSEKAGKFLFGRNDFRIIPNPVEVNRFLKDKDEDLLKNLKEELTITDEELVLGHIGRFSVEKNHIFILKIAEKLKQLNYQFKVILVGDGELKPLIIDKIIQMNLEDKVILAGNRINIEDFYSLFDILLFPSIHEGFGNVAVESQISGKKVIASNGVSTEVDLNLGLVKFIDIASVDSWIKEIKYTGETKQYISKLEILNAVNRKGFGIDKTIELYSHIYDN